MIDKIRALLSLEPVEWFPWNDDVKDTTGWCSKDEALARIDTLSRALAVAIEVIEMQSDTLKQYLESENCEDTSCPYPTRMMCNKPMHKITRWALESARRKIEGI